MHKRDRNRLFAALNGIIVPSPFDLGDFCREVERVRGRPLQLLPIPAGLAVSAPCGMVVTTEAADIVFYEPATTPAHRAQIVAHELAHLLLGHVDSDSAFTALAGTLTALNPALIQRVLGRTRYDTPVERDAEALATLILTSKFPTDDNDALRLLGDVFGHQVKES